MCSVSSFISGYGSLESALRESNQIFRVLRAFFPIRSRENKSPRLKPGGTQSKSAAGSKSAGGSHSEITSSPETDQFPRTLLLLSAWQMIEEGYPLPLKGNIFKQ